MQDDFLSIIGSSFFWPIAYLWEKIEEKKPVKANEVKTGDIENGYAVAIVAITMAMLESYLNRTRHIMMGRQEYDLPTKKVRDLIIFFKQKFPDSGILEKLIEIYAIRHVIVHNHVWEARIDETESGFIHATPPKLDDRLYGDKRFSDILDKKSLTSKRLKLNLFPTRIDREDARKVLMTVYEILYFIESKDRNYCAISWIPIYYKGRGMQFSKFIRILSGENSDHNPPIAEIVPE